MSWVRGRFEGTTIGEPVAEVSSNDAARRYTVALHSGRVHEAELVPEPDVEPAGEEIRQDRLRGVELPGSLTGGDGGTRTLFDVRIRDFRLAHPIESNGRSYSAVTGTILARLRPAEPAPPEDLVATRPNTAEPILGGTPAPAPAAESAAPTRRGEPGRDAAEQLSTLRWVLAIVFLVVGTALLGMACGGQTAALWAAPVALVVLVRRFARPAPVRTPSLQWAIGGGALLFQLAVLARPIGTAWQLACLTPIREDLLWLAPPIAVAALVRSRWSLVATTIVWTAVACSWCAQLDGTCEPGALSGAQATAGASAALAVPPPTTATTRHPVPPPATTPSSSSGPPRTDSDGRWPVMPPAVTPGVDFGVDATSGSPRPIADEPIDMAPGPGATSSHRTTPDATPQRPTTGTLPATTPSRPNGPPGARHSNRSKTGGWAAPDHRRAAREMVLISVEQANRTPQSFFGEDADRRVYLPTDPIFEPGGADVSERGALHLTRLAALLNLHPERRVALDVHTDADGSPAKQMRLSGRRADALVAWLVDRGHLASDQLESSGFGGSRPIVPPDGSYDDQRPNRRIEVRLLD